MLRYFYLNFLTVNDFKYSLNISISQNSLKGVVETT